MSLESNQRDFEKALKELAELELPEGELKDTVAAVVDEYYYHYSSDITELVDTNEDLRDRIEELEGIINDS